MKRGILIATIIAGLLVASAASAQKTVVTWSTWLTGESLDTQVALFELFEQKNPDIKVEWTTTPYTEYLAKLLIQLAAGETADVMHTTIDNAPAYIRAGLFLDVAEWVERDIDFDKYVKFSGIYNYDGHVWGGLESHNQVYPLYYNVDMFKEAGVETPNDYYEKGSWYWEDFVEVAKKMTKDTDGDGVTDVWGFAPYNWLQWGWEIWLLNNGADWMTEDFTSAAMDTPEAIEALEFYAGLIYKDKVAPIPGEVPVIGDIFEAQKVAMTIQGTWMLNVWGIRIEDFEWDVAHPPTVKGKPPVNSIAPGADGLVSGVTKHPEEAWKLARFFLEEETQMAKGKGRLVMPVLKDALYSEDYLRKPPQHISAVLEIMEYARPFLVFEGTEEVQRAIYSELDAVFLNQKSAAEAAKAATEAANRVLAKIEK